MRVIKNRVWEAKIKCSHCKSPLMIYSGDVKDENKGEEDIFKKTLSVICAACDGKIYLEKKTSGSFKNFLIRCMKKDGEQTKQRVNNNY